MTADRTHADQIRDGIANHWLPGQQLYERAMAALDVLLADLAAATERADRAEAEVERVINEALDRNVLYVREMRYRDAAEARLAAAREALAAIANGRDDVPAMRITRARVIARAALAASPPDTGDTA